MEKAFCDAHSGHCKELEHLVKSDQDQWETIGRLRDNYTKILTGMVLTLLGVIANLIIALVK